MNSTVLLGVLARWLGPIVSLALGSAAASVATTTVARWQQPKPDQTVARAFREGDRYVEGVGACSATSESIECWNMDGQADADLSKRIRDVYSGGYNGDISLRFGRRNEFLVVRVPQQFGVNLASADGMFSNTMQDNNPSGARLQWIRVTPEPGQTETGVLVSFQDVPGEPPVDLPFSKGKSAVVGGVTFEVGTWHEASPESLRGTYIPSGSDQRYWTIAMGGVTWLQQMVYFNFTAVDRDGRAIHYVDPKGHEISGLRFLELQQAKPNAASPYLGPNGNATFQAGGQATDGAFTLTTNIDPGEIGSIRIGTSRQRRVLITGFPLQQAAR